MSPHPKCRSSLDSRKINLGEVKNGISCPVEPNTTHIAKIWLRLRERLRYEIGRSFLLSPAIVHCISKQ
jgi:hypothetical protein